MYADDEGEAQGLVHVRSVVEGCADGDGCLGGGAWWLAWFPWCEGGRGESMTAGGWPLEGGRSEGAAGFKAVALHRCRMGNGPHGDSIACRRVLFFCMCSYWGRTMESASCRGT